MVVPLFENFQQIVFPDPSRGETKIIYNEDLGFGELVDDLAVDAVAPCQGHLIENLGVRR